MELDLSEDFLMLKVSRMVWTCWELKDYERLFKGAIERFENLKKMANFAGWKQPDSIFHPTRSSYTASLPRR